MRVLPNDRKALVRTYLAAVGVEAALEALGLGAASQVAAGGVGLLSGALTGGWSDDDRQAALEAGIRHNEDIFHAAEDAIKACLRSAADSAAEGDAEALRDLAGGVAGNLKAALDGGAAAGGAGFDAHTLVAILDRPAKEWEAQKLLPKEDWAALVEELRFQLNSERGKERPLPAAAREAAAAELSAHFVPRFLNAVSRSPAAGFKVLAALLGSHARRLEDLAAAERARDAAAADRHREVMQRLNALSARLVDAGKGFTLREDERELLLGLRGLVRAEGEQTRTHTTREVGAAVEIVREEGEENRAHTTREGQAVAEIVIERVELSEQRILGALTAPAPPAGPRSGNVPARGERPFVGRETELAALERALGEGKPALAALVGPSGVGKSETAREFARRRLADYPGGTFVVSADSTGPPLDLLRCAQVHCGWTPPANLPLADQCQAALLWLTREPCLVIYDNATHPEAVTPWLPPAGSPAAVLVTSTHRRFEGFRVVEQGALPDGIARELVTAIAGPEAARRHGSDIVRAAAGLPAQLVPDAVAARDYDERAPAPAPEVSSSFDRPWAVLSEDARLLLLGAAFFRPETVAVPALREALAWEPERFNAALRAAWDLRLIEGAACGLIRDGESPGRVHLLLRAYVRERRGELRDEECDRLTASLAAVLSAAAGAVRANPADAARARALLAFEPDAAVWPRIAEPDGTGRALLELGHYGEAIDWYTRAVAEAEKGDRHGRVDPASLGTSLHQVGFCHSQEGRYGEAIGWYTRAVAEKEKGDRHGRVDPESLGRSLHEVGFCHSQEGRYGEAIGWYTRAVAEKEKGDLHGRVDPASLGRSLHAVGFCHSQEGRYGEAIDWYTRAVEQAEKGDLHGRVDPASLGTSLHEVGFCHSQEGRYGEAIGWYTRAVAEKEKGDRHGRVDPASLGTSLHEVGFCHSQEGRYGEAIGWYTRAVAEKEKGDRHGRVDPASLGTSLHEVGFCHSQEGRYGEAIGWYTWAVAEKEKGDRHGRVDADLVAQLRRSLAGCRRLKGGG